MYRLIMSAKLNIDRHFLFLHNENLAVFAERVLRSTHHNIHVPNATGVWPSLQDRCCALREVLNNPALKRKDRTEAVREQEAHLLVQLSRMADCVEASIDCKSDIFTTGFRPLSEQRKLSETRRRQRLSAKLAHLEHTGAGI
jgi:hypothetical protein